MTVTATVQRDIYKTERELETRYLLSDTGVARLLQNADGLRTNAVNTGAPEYVDLAVDLEQEWSQLATFNKLLLRELFIQRTPVEQLLSETGFSEPMFYSLIRTAVGQLRHRLNGHSQTGEYV